MRLRLKVKKDPESTGKILFEFFADKYVSDNKRIQSIGDCILVEFDIIPNKRPLNLLKAISCAEIVEVSYGELFEDNSEETLERETEEWPKDDNSEETFERKTEEEPTDENLEETFKGETEEVPTEDNLEETCERGTEEVSTEITLSTVLKNIAIKCNNFEEFLNKVIEFFNLEQSEFTRLAIKTIIESSGYTMKWYSIKEKMKATGLKIYYQQEKYIKDNVQKKVSGNLTAKDFIMVVARYSKHNFNDEDRFRLSCFPTIPKFEQKLKKAATLNFGEDQIAYILDSMGLKTLPKEQQKIIKSFVTQQVFNKDQIIQKDAVYERGILANLINSFLKENNISEFVKTEEFISAIGKLIINLH